MAIPPGLRVFACLALVLAAGLVSACASDGRPVGRDVEGTYLLGTLSAEVPDRIPAVIAAADAALRGRGYTIVARVATEDRGEVVARPYRPGPLERIIVGAELTDAGSEITVAMRPIPDQRASLAIMDDLLRRLGR